MSNQRPVTLSVGIPTFNQADYLEAALESLFRQTRSPDEIVVSDHYSTDHTQAVLAKYQGRIRSLQPPPGSNLTGQYNFTLSSQTGDWITLLNSDDLVHPNFCEVLLRGAASDPNAALVRAGWDRIDAAGAVIDRNYLLSVPRIEPPPANLLSQKWGPKVNCVAFALRRTAFEQSGPILDTIESLVDWALVLQVCPFGPFVYEHEIIASYRVGHGGDKYRDRLPAWVRDQQRIFAEVMPLAAQRLRMTDTAWIAEASRYNLIRYLSHACENFATEERAAVAPLFEPWAKSVNAEDILTAFARGETIATPRTLATRVKTKLRPLLHGVMGTLRKP
jgi:glycosyltransferase involved in cell wall biosynthesis